MPLTKLSRSRLPLPLALALALGGFALVTTGCGKPDLGRADGAKLTARADGGGELLVEGWPTISLSKDEVAGRTSVELSGGKTTDVVSFKLPNGQWVNVAFLAGQTARSPVETPSPAPYDVVVGTLITASKTPDAVVGQVRQAKGTGGVAKVLARAAATEGPTWEKRLPTLSPEDREELAKAFVALVVDPAADPAVLGRAVKSADVSALTKEQLVARLTPLSNEKDLPRGAGAGAGVLLRVLAKKSADAARIGCAALGARTWSLEEPDPEKKSFADAALMSIAAGALSCDKVDALVKEDPCATSYRCGPNGPLLPSDTSDQSEPLCDAKKLETAVDAELSRPATEVAKDPHAGRTSLYAYAAFVRGARPASPELDKHQARRLYAITQPKTPECEALTEIGKPCHANEALLRDLACRNEGKTVSVGTLRFQVDDEKKTLSGVETAPPP
jgi:hypothetical protein